MYSINKGEYIMSKKIYLNEVGVGVLFEDALDDKAIFVINTTPHETTFLSPKGDVVNVPPTIIVNASTYEEKVDELYVTTQFVGTEDGIETIRKIRESFEMSRINAKLIIVGSIIAAQAYPGDIVAMTPAPGFERVAPSEKRMNCNKFTVFKN